MTRELTRMSEATATLKNACVLVTPSILAHDSRFCQTCTPRRQTLEQTIVRG